MEFFRKLRWVLYPSVFLLMFLLGSYCTFPKDVLQEMAETSITRALVDLRPQAHGIPKVVIKDVSLWRMLGVSMHDIKLAWPPPNGGVPVSINLDSLQAKAGLFSLMMGGQSIFVKAGLYDGEFESEIKLKKQKDLKFLRVRANKINFAKMDFIESVIGSPLAGTLDILSQLEANTDLTTDGTGSIDITIKQGVFGPGILKMPSGGFMAQISVPKVTLGDFSANLVLEKGQVTSKKFEFTGGDLQGEINLNLVLNKLVSASKVNGDGWFSLKKEFINSNETIKMLFDLVPELKDASMGNGRVPITIRGTLKNPKFSFGSGGGLSDNTKPKRLPINDG